MFDKMVKMKNKKGFTLVEMLVVIAIIAILVAIIVPVVGNSTQKSRAATNAANLRSIEGQLSTMRVTNPEAFENAVKKFGQSLGAYEGMVNGIMGAFGFDMEEFLASGNAVAEWVNYNIYHSTASDAGVLTITVGPEYEDIVLDNVPAAVGVDVPGMKVTEGTPMTVYISDTDIVASYESGTNSYSKYDFAEVAETGAFSGATGTGGTTNAGATGGVVDYAVGWTACKIANQHTWGKDCYCIYCNTESTHFVGKGHNCTNCGQNKFPDNHDYSVVDGDWLRCSGEGCESKIDNHSCRDTATVDCKCDVCEKAMHNYSNYVCTKCGDITVHTYYNASWYGIFCDHCGKTKYTSAHGY